MHPKVARLIRFALIGLVAGTIFIGAGGRIAMRILALANGNDTAFSWGGSLEVMLYGALAGAGCGILAAVLLSFRRTDRLVTGLGLAIAAYGATIATLPRHIIDLMPEFAQVGWLAFALFGLCFTAFGYALLLAERSAKR